MDQVSDTPLFRMVRAGDAPASKQAAVDAQDVLASEHRRKIVEALATDAPRGMGAKRIGLLTGLTNVQITRRTPELRLAGFIVTFDGKSGAGHVSPSVLDEDGCHPHALSAHEAAARAIYEGEARQRRLAQELTA